MKEKRYYKGPDEIKGPFTISLNDRQKSKLKQLSIEKGMSVSSLIVKSLKLGD